MCGRALRGLDCIAARFEVPFGVSSQADPNGRSRREVFGCRPRSEQGEPGLSSAEDLGVVAKKVDAERTPRQVLEAKQIRL